MGIFLGIKMFLPAMDSIAHNILATYHPRARAQTPLGKNTSSDQLRSQQNFSVQGAHYSYYPTAPHSPCTCHT
jgi:hypothetical protein